MMDNNVKDVFLTSYDTYLFGQGTHYEIYNKMGAHPAIKNGTEGVYFSVWAPHAREIYVVGDFNNWNKDAKDSKMNMISSGGIYETFIENAKEGQLYKFLILTLDGRWIYKADPYEFQSQLRPDTASEITNLNGFDWKDEAWINKKSTTDHLREPMFIYECHLGSWLKKCEDDDNGFLTYRELAEKLSQYVKNMGYTHIELLGIAEYPFDGSWGYQVTGYYAPTARYGKAKDFMYFVNYMHNQGIGVILDWVPAHFPKDEFALSNFDGQACYEYADPKKGEHPEWGTKVFNYEKNEVTNFLIANGLFWIDKYHIDGLRVDAVASMLYLDYGRKNGEWIPNKYGGNGNLEAVAFLKHFNSILNKRYPQAVTIAEESTAWPNITGNPDSSDTLGFTFKWNMGWMHDFLEYMQLDPYFRKFNHDKLTFGMMYAYSERFILVLSHDEVVHLKKSMIDKMPGTVEDKFDNLKLAYAFMLGHPGKKLLFMGQDIAQWREWSEKRSLDWYLLNEPENKNLHEFFKKCLKLYHKYPCLYNNDYDSEGFRWINANDRDNSVYSFIRISYTGRKHLLFVLNFTPVKRPIYRLGVPAKVKYKLVLSNEENNNTPIITTDNIAYDGYDQSIEISIPRYGICIYEFSTNKLGKTK